MQKLKFSLDEFEPLEEKIEEDYESVKKDRFSKVKIRLFSDGENAHTEPVDLEALKNSADSAYDIPLIAELNPYRSNQDFGGHGTLTGKEFSFGFVKESKDNPIIFEKDEKGKTFITLYGLIWKKYFNNVIDILKKNNNKVEVSVELDIVNGSTSRRGKPIMKQFVLNAITFLGKVTTAACKGAQAELCFSADDHEKFIEDKRNYIMKHFADTIKINNSKEAAVDGKWSNPRQKLLSPILSASNKTALLNEAYLFWEDKGEEGITLSDVSYPHHVIKNGELVLHIRGVQAAFSRLAQQGKVEGKAKAHLLRHYRELGLNTENFEEFGLTKAQFEQFFAEDCGKEETDLVVEEENKVEEGINEECKDTEAEMCDTIEEGCDNKVEEECPEEEKENFENKDENDAEDEKDSEEDKEEDEEEMSSDDGVPPEKPIETANETSVEELMKRLQKLEADNEAYLEKINDMSDYEDLKAFKMEAENKIKQEAEMNKMAEVFEEITSKGVKISEETKEELFSRREEFSNIDGWSNFVKAYAFDNCEKTEEGIISFEMPRHDYKETENLGVWATLKNKFTK